MSRENVEFCSPNSSGNCAGVLFNNNSSRGIILVHAWWGLNDEVIQHGEDISALSGMTVLVPDLYRGKLTKNREEAGHYMDGLHWQGAVQDIQACAQHLKNNHGCHKVGITGFCMGGALCFVAAAKIPEIHAAASFYGIPKPHLADLRKINIPVQSHFGQNDDVVGLSSPQDFYPLSDALCAAGVDLELHVYAGAGHGFVHPSYPTYHREAADKAISHLVAFMQRHLE